MFVGIGYYKDGSIGEVFVDTAKCGSEFGTLMNAFATMASIAIQYGAGPREVAEFLMKSNPKDLPHLIGSVIMEALV